MLFVRVLLASCPTALAFRSDVPAAAGSFAQLNVTGRGPLPWQIQRATEHRAAGPDGRRGSLQPRSEHHLGHRFFCTSRYRYCTSLFCLGHLDHLAPKCGCWPLPCVSQSNTWFFLPVEALKSIRIKALPLGATLSTRTEHRSGASPVLRPRAGWGQQGCPVGESEEEPRVRA